MVIVFHAVTMLTSVGARSLEAGQQCFVGIEEQRAAVELASLASLLCRCGEVRQVETVYQAMSEAARQR